MVSSTPLQLFTPGKDPVPVLQEVEWAPRPVWTGDKLMFEMKIQNIFCAQKILNYGYKFNKRDFSVRNFCMGWLL